MLDMIRGLAALEVALGHLRGFLFDDYFHLANPSLLVKAFYFLTGFGHQSVTVFFVLSGYLVGGSVLAARSEGFFERYAVQRLSRLWIVLLPCLAATAIWNLLGYHAGGADFLNGKLDAHTFVILPVRTDIFAFLGNLFFLQTIVTPVYGDNVPLWSLANEFWYYVLFPLLFFGFKKETRNKILLRSICVASGIAILIALPWGICLGFIVWLSGMAIAAFEKYGIDKIFSSKWYAVPVLFACAGVFACSRFYVVHDIVLGLSFAAALPVFMRLPSLPKLVASPSAWLADFSYTLYLAHFSLAAFIWYGIFDSQRLQPSWAATVRFGFSALVVIAYSFGLSLVFERNTDKLRRFVMRHLPGQESNRALARSIPVATATNEAKKKADL
jgi:peptidoglycan/LPS O-acetylase OafA/YrhL